MNPDLINGLFEVVGAFFTWMSVRRLYHDKVVKGIYWPGTVFFTGWGVWNLYYYPVIDQWFSFFGGVILVAGNVIWIALLVQYKCWVKEG
jgi:hypothetical protein